MTLTLLHNPRDSESCPSLASLTARGLERELRRPVDQAPEAADLKRIIGQAGLLP